MPSTQQVARTWVETAETDEIDLREYIAVLWRQRWLILAVVVAALAAAVAASLVMPPVYKLETTLALAQYQGGFYGNQAVAQEVLMSEDFLRQAAGRAGLPQDREYVASLIEALKVEPVQESNLVKITLETSDPKAGKALLQSMADLYAERSEKELAAQRELLTGQLAVMEKWQADIAQNIDQTRKLLAGSAGYEGFEARLERAMLLTTLQGQEQQRLALLDRYLELQRELASIRGVQVIQPPEVPLKPVRPRPALNLAVAGVLGLMAAVLLAFGLEYFARPAREPEGSK